MSVLTQKTLQTIAAQNIRPVPAWVSRLRDGLFWGGVLLLVILAVAATALSWHALFEIDWSAYVKAHFSWLEILVSGVPLFSLFLLGLFLWVSLLLLQQTRRGYRYSMPLSTTVFLLGSLACGYWLEGSSLDEPVERFLLRSVPHAEKLSATLIPSAERQWSQPERGLLGGAVLSSGATDMTLLDTAQKLWTVDYSQATLDKSVNLDPYEQVKVIGSQDGEDTFRAAEIKHWDRLVPSDEKAAERDPVIEERSRQKKAERDQEKRRVEDENAEQEKADALEKQDPEQDEDGQDEGDAPDTSENEHDEASEGE